MLALAAIGFVAGCGFYSVSGGIPAHVRTVGVEFFSNATTESGIEERVSRAISDRIVGQSQVRFASSRSADAVFRGNVVRVSEEPLTYTGTQASRYQVTLIVDASVWDRTRRRTLWEREGIRGQGEYDATGGIAARDAAQAQVVREVAQQVVDGFFSGW
jgi:outer membrane lipopolysaccharide assembly protein LptE/RlpB